jgi:surface-adhesin protein E
MPFTIRPDRRFPEPFLKLPLVYFLSFASLITLLVLSSGPAYGEWVAVDKKADGTAYADPDTIRFKGDVVTMWTLHDFKTMQTMGGHSFLSIKGQAEYDCAEERYRPLAFIEFSGNMGSSKVVTNGSTEQEWRPVAPGSVGQGLWKFACGKK